MGITDCSQYKCRLEIMIDRADVPLAAHYCSYYAGQLSVSLVKYSVWQVIRILKMTCSVKLLHAMTTNSHCTPHCCKIMKSNHNIGSPTFHLLAHSLIKLARHFFKCSVGGVLVSQQSDQGSIPGTTVTLAQWLSASYSSPQAGSVRIIM